MARISIVDLEVFWSVGVTDEERAKPQRLLVSVEMTIDISAAALSDRVEKTINYYDVAQEILRYGEGRSWKLLEKVATNLIELLMTKFKPDDMTLEIKKFVIPQARYVSLTLSRER
jgi:7,8-dihydroneopterin aldolase/epimerase/oxygenase